MSVPLKTGADARALRMIKFPAQFNEKVDMKKVNLPVIKKWVSTEVTRILKADDDVVTEMIFTILEGSKSPNIKQLQSDLAGFLDKDAAPFCLELWKLCLSAQADPNGIPKELLEAKKTELIQERLAEDKARDEAFRREAYERERDQELTRIREREYGQRERGGRGGRRGRDRSFDRRSPPRDARSPPRQRESHRGTDSYVPRGRGRRNEPSRRRQRSPSYGWPSSRSRSPPRRRQRYDSSSEYSRSSPPPQRIARSSDGDEERNTRQPPRSEDRRRHRSPSPSRRRRSSSFTDNGRTSPRRRSSPRPSQPRRRPRDESSRSRSPPSKRRNTFGPDDLMSRTDRSRDNPRLSREGSSYSEVPPQQRQERVSLKTTNDGVEHDEVGNDS